VTYNFDPDLWYANEHQHLKRQLASGALDQEGFATAVEDLDRRYEEMVDRLDGTYSLPDTSADGG